MEQRRSLSIETQTLFLVRYLESDPPCFHLRSRPRLVLHHIRPVVVIRVRVIPPRCHPSLSPPVYKRFPRRLRTHLDLKVLDPSPILPFFQRRNRQLIPHREIRPSTNWFPHIVVGEIQHDLQRVPSFFHYGPNIRAVRDRSDHVDVLEDDAPKGVDPIVHHRAVHVERGWIGMIRSGATEQSDFFWREYLEEMAPEVVVPIVRVCVVADGMEVELFDLDELVDDSVRGDRQTGGGPIDTADGEDADGVQREVRAQLWLIGGWVLDVDRGQSRQDW